MKSKKTVLITGTVGGIRCATLNLFAEKGWCFINVDRNEFGDGLQLDDLGTGSLEYDQEFGGRIGAEI